MPTNLLIRQTHEQWTLPIRARAGCRIIADAPAGRRRATARPRLITWRRRVGHALQRESRSRRSVRVGGRLSGPAEGEASEGRLVRGSWGADRVCVGRSELLTACREGDPLATARARVSAPAGEHPGGPESRSRTIPAAFVVRCPDHERAAGAGDRGRGAELAAAVRRVLAGVGQLSKTKARRYRQPLNRTRCTGSPPPS